jgi:hypothetical protein
MKIPKINFKQTNHKSDLVILIKSLYGIIKDYTLTTFFRVFFFLY